MFSNEYFFGLGSGHLSEKFNKIAEKHGAYLVNYTDAACNCGGGCKPHTCKKSRRHWFAKPNKGFPSDDVVAKIVMEEINNETSK